MQADNSKDTIKKGDKTEIAIPTINKGLTRGKLTVNCYESCGRMRDYSWEVERLVAWLRSNVPARFFNALLKELDKSQRLRRTDGKARVDVGCNSDMTGGGVYIYDRHGKEIVSWTEDEWKQDATSVVATCNAIKLFYTQGADALIARIGRKP